MSSLPHPAAARIVSTLAKIRSACASASSGIVPSTASPQLPGAEHQAGRPVNPNGMAVVGERRVDPGRGSGGRVSSVAPRGQACGVFGLSQAVPVALYPVPSASPNAGAIGMTGTAWRRWEGPSLAGIRRPGPGAHGGAAAGRGGGAAWAAPAGLGRRGDQRRHRRPGGRADRRRCPRAPDADAAHRQVETSTWPSPAPSPIPPAP